MLTPDSPGIPYASSNSTWWYTQRLQSAAAFMLPHCCVQADVAQYMQDIAGKLQPCIAQRANHLVAIISYDLAQQLKPPMTAAFNFIICDESHSLKSPTAKRTLYITPLVRKAKRAILISGTPMKSIPIELHTQVCPCMLHANAASDL